LKTKNIEIFPHFADISDISDMQEKSLHIVEVSCGTDACRSCTAFNENSQIAHRQLHWLVMWYFDRPGVPASGHPQGQRPYLQPVSILLGHPTIQHKKFALDISCFAFFPMLFQILDRVLISERQFEHGL
jgi:hypothetical protein